MKLEMSSPTVEKVTTIDGVHVTLRDRTGSDITLHFDSIANAERACREIQHACQDALTEGGSERVLIRSYTPAAFVAANLPGPLGDALRGGK